MSGLTTVTLTGTVLGLDGRPRAGADVWVSFQAGVRPPLEGAAASLTDIPYPPFVPPVDPGTGLPVTEPDPVPLFATPLAGLAGADVGTRHTTTDASGAWALDVPTPSALCYAVGARTDADLDPARGGRYAAVYHALLGSVGPFAFEVDEAQIAAGGTLDVTALLSGGGG